MDVKATSTMHVVRKEDKHAILREFIEQDIDARRGLPPGCQSSVVYYLIARSPDSPVARAVADFAEKAEQLGIKIQAVFAASGPKAAMHNAKIISCRDTRLIHDPRLLDAHEALLLGDSYAWVGDCMRRDPAQNDAYERFSTACGFTMASVRKAFDQLWNTARPLNSHWLDYARDGQAQPICDDEVIASSAMSSTPDAPLPVPATRH